MPAAYPRIGWQARHVFVLQDCRTRRVVDRASVFASRHTVSVVAWTGRAVTSVLDASSGLWYDGCDALGQLS